MYIKEEEIMRKKIIIGILSSVFVFTFFAGSVSAGTYNLANETIYLSGTIQKRPTKTTDTGKLACTANLVSGKPRQILVQVFDGSINTFITQVIATESGGTAYKNYPSSCDKYKKKGTKLYLTIRDYKGGAFGSYKTSGNVNYY